MKKISLLDILRKRYPDLGRERLSAAVVCGDVWVNGERVRDPKRLLDPSLDIRFDMPEQVLADQIPGLPWVSRGAEKLAGMLDAWQIDPAGLVWLDAGASTGGFTHCLLRRGATLVHAVDVGYNQLDWRLRQLSAVRCMERTNIMALDALDPMPDCAVADLSFRTVAAPARKIVDLCRQGVVYALIKPQFERKYLKDSGAFDGIVDQGEHRDIIADVVRRLGDLDLGICRLVPSVLRGTQGNQEYFVEIRSGIRTDLDRILASMHLPADPDSQ